MELEADPTLVQGGGQQRVEVEGELRPDPLVPALPARPVQEHVLAVLRHVLQQVVGEAQVGRGQRQQTAQLRVLDLDAGLPHLAAANQGPGLGGGGG